MRKTKQVRAFLPDNEWINKKAKKRHTVAAVIIEDLVAAAKRLEELLNENS